MLDTNRKLIITHHARDRADQFQVPRQQLIEMFWSSEEEPIPPGAKLDRPGQVTIFRRYKTFVMVVGLVVDKHHGGDAYLLATIYDQRMNLKFPQI